MLAMAAISGPQRVLWVQKGVDAEKVFGGKRARALGAGFMRCQGGGVLRQRSLFRAAGVNVSRAIKAAPQHFRLAAFPEEGVAEEAATDEPLEAEPDVGEPVFEGPTVKVKFELQKECHFGQQFKVIGDDPQFGNWDPSAAVLLNWTEGHLWTAEVDVPEGKKIEFKYILSSQEGEVEWQPGSNLVLETVAGAEPLVISKAWEETVPEPTNEPDSVTTQPEVQPDDELDTKDWEAVVSDGSEVNTPVDALADAAASAAAGALNAGVKAATALEGGLDAVSPLSGSSSGETDGVAESEEKETPPAVEVPVVDAALAAAAEELTSKNGASTETTSQAETATTEEQPRIEEEQPRIEEEQPQVEEQPKKLLNPFRKDLEWLTKTLFGR